MRLLLVLILLGFPVLEMFLLAKIGHYVGWWLAAWLIMSALTGVALIKEARIAMVRELSTVIRSGGSNIPACPASVPTVSTPTPATSRSRASSSDVVR